MRSLMKMDKITDHSETQNIDEVLHVSPLQAHQRLLLTSKVKVIRITEHAIVALWVLFLDASSHLYNRLCPSVGWLVGLSVTHS